MSIQSVRTSVERVILTGASDGIGKAIALEFARRGHALALIARREDKLREVKKECEALGATKVLIAPIDVTDEAKFDQALVYLDTELGGATIFIANAGVTGRSSFQEGSWEAAKKCFLVNIFAAVQGLERMKLRMMARKSGTLCGISSIAGARGMPTSGPYSCSKAALSTYLETMRVDLIPYGLKVVDVAPGFIDTEMTKANKGKMPFLMQPGPAAKIFVDGILNGDRFVIAPKPWRLIYTLVRLAPRSWFDYFVSRAYQSIRG